MDMKNFNRKLEEYQTYQIQRPEFIDEIKNSVSMIDYKNPSFAFAKFISILVCEIEYNLKQYSEKCLNETNNKRVRIPSLPSIEETIDYYHDKLKIFTQKYNGQLKTREFKELLAIRKDSIYYLQYAYRAAIYTHDKDEAINLLNIINKLIKDNNICVDTINYMIRMENERRQEIYDNNPDGVSKPKLIQEMEYITLNEIKVI
jgi:hypothetical protein